MTETIIKVENLGKKYLIRHQQGERYRYTTLRDSIASTSKRLGRNVLHFFRNSSQSHTIEEDFWALQDLSFDIQQGDRLGIIGRNGAGKTTFLKILSRITQPTTGRVFIKGRVASLLEVGTGFHPELTGRENIFLNGAILGMSKTEIKNKFDEIIEFAEVEKFLDTPVKRYSSGMYVRLAFAIAAHLDPDILIVDEVLAVGDALFQKKCLGKMQEVSEKGRTVLFVSHNMEAIRKLCNRAILLVAGKMFLTGEPDLVLRKYLEEGVQNSSVHTIPPPENENVPGFAYRLVIENDDGKPVNEVLVGQSWQIRVYFKMVRKVEHFIIALGLHTDFGFAVRTSFSVPQNIEPGEYQAVFREETVLLTSGNYPIVIGLSSYERSFHYVENAGILRIAEFSDGLERVRIRNVGLLLNSNKVEICKC